MTLREKQSKFSRYVGLLILYAYIRGYEITIDDVRAYDGHCENSFHYKKLAIDINLFKDGEYLTETKEYNFLGFYWKCLDPDCTWGGDWDDGRHFSYGEHGRKE